MKLENMLLTIAGLNAIIGSGIINFENKTIQTIGYTLITLNALPFAYAILKNYKDTTFNS